VAGKSNGYLFARIHRFVEGLKINIIVFENRCAYFFHQDIFAFVAPVYAIKKDSGQDSNAMLVSALSILSYVVLSPELGSERETDKILQQRSSKHETRKKLRVLEVEELLSVSRDASDGCLWSLLNVLCSLLDAVVVRHPSKRSILQAVSSLHNVGTSSSWELLKNRCFRVIKRYISSSCVASSCLHGYESFSVSVVPFVTTCWSQVATVPRYNL
jgi:hypothetical protein